MVSAAGVYPFPMLLRHHLMQKTSNAVRISDDFSSNGRYSSPGCRHPPAWLGPPLHHLSRRLPYLCQRNGHISACYLRMSRDMPLFGKKGGEISQKPQLQATPSSCPGWVVREPIKGRIR